jgi:hypothetical protein
MDKLSPAEERVILAMRGLGNFERIEIMVVDGRLRIQIKSTVVEDFPRRG